MILPLIIAGFFLVGCSRDQEDEPVSKKPSPQPEPPSDRVYRRSCLQDESCPLPEREAALMDYVGAVYGEAGRVKFTSPNDTFVLTPAEETYVLNTFGRPGKPPEGIRSFLGRGADVFLSQRSYMEHPMCSTDRGKAPIQFTDSQLGMGVVLYGFHGCAKNYLDQLKRSGLELSMGANPENWAFFLEGHGGKKSEFILYEFEFFEKVANVLKIPLHNAVPVRTFHKKVIQLAMEKTNYVEMDFTVAAVFQGVVGRMRENPNADPLQMERTMAELMAPDFGQKPEVVLKALHQFLQKYPTFLEAGTESDRRIMVLAEISNQLSREQLKDKIEGIAKEKPNLKSLFVIGAGHKDLIQEIYTNKK